MTDQSDFESLVGLSMSKPAVPLGMAGLFLAIRDCGLHFVDAEIVERPLPQDDSEVPGGALVS